MTRALRRIDVGQSVRVLATDVNSPTEFAAFCDISGHALIESTTAAGVFTLTIQKMAVD